MSLSKSESERIEIMWRQIINYVIGAIVIVMLLVVMFLPVGQIAYYLYSGSWYSVSVLDLFRMANSVWADNPQSWFGLHKFFEWMPLLAADIILFLVVGILWKVNHEMIQSLIHPAILQDKK